VEPNRFGPDPAKGISHKDPAACIRPGMTRPVDPPVAFPYYLRAVHTLFHADIPFFAQCLLPS
jgi:hypothetical protein